MAGVLFLIAIVTCTYFGCVLACAVLQVTSVYTQCVIMKIYAINIYSTLKSKSNMKFLKDEPEMQAFAAVVIFCIIMLIACAVALHIHNS